MATSFTISYGYLGGPALGKELRRLMQSKGYVFKPLGEPVDIVIAHSAGCWFVPASTNQSLTLFVGMPLLSEVTQRQFIAINLRNMYYYVKNLRTKRAAYLAICQIYYGLTQPTRNSHIARHARRLQPAVAKQGQHVFIANQHDPWPQRPKLPSYIDTTDWAFIGLPGTHDNIWETPEYYVAIIDHYARLLA